MRMAAAKLQIMELLGWSEEQYNHYQWEQGRKYIEVYLPEPGAAKAVRKTREYWNWWKLNWYRRDRAIMDSMQTIEVGEKEFVQNVYVREGQINTLLYKAQPITVAEMEADYREIHDGETLAKAENTFGEILSRSFCNVLAPAIGNLEYSEEPNGGTDEPA